MSDGRTPDRPGFVAAESALVAPREAEFAAPLVRPEESSFLPGAYGAGPLPATATPFSLGMIWRRKWTLLSLFVLLSGVTIPLIWMYVHPQYEASAIVRVAPVITPILYESADSGMVPLYQSYLNTQVSVIRSPKVLQRVLDQSAVRETTWFNEDTGTWLKPALPALQRLRKDLVVSPRRATELIDVSMTAAKAGDAKIIADTVVRQYLDVFKETDKQVDNERWDRLSQKEAELREDIDRKTITKNALSKKLGTDSPDVVRTQKTQYLNELHQEQETHQRTRRLLEKRLATLKAAQGEGEMTGPAVPEDDETIRMTTRYAGDPEWRRRRESLDSVQHDLKLAADQFGDQHPTMKALVSREAFCRSQLLQREKELDAPGAVLAPPTALAGEALDPAYDVRTLERLIDDRRDQETLLTETIDAQTKSKDEFFRSAQDLSNIDHEIAAKQDEIKEVQDGLKVMRMESQSRLGRVSSAAEAVMPFEPSRDRRILFTAMAIAGALAAGIGAALLRTLMDPSLRQVHDVTNSVRIPFLGLLPRIRFESEIMDDSSAFLQESMRMIRTALLDRVPAKGGCSVLITSPGAQAGKTSVALLLSKSLASVGHKVLLVDGDLRRTSLTQRLSLAKQVGLTDVLTGKAAQDRAVVRDHWAGVDVLPAGSSEGEPNLELLANGAFSLCLADWKKAYDFVVLDSPPVLPVADARILARQVDGTLLTLRASHSRRTDATDALNQLTISGGRTWGTILVGADRGLGYDSRHAYY